MKLNRLHLENFGKFKDYNLDLASGFNVIHGENEDGKSTIMAFIQMMFYGYSGRTRDLSLNLRRRFRPWQGPAMQGKIWFESGGSLFRLERVFGQSNSTDQVTLWNETRGERLKLSSGNDPGREFFSLGEDAFARSVFIRQGGSLISGSSSQDELTQRLLNLVTTGSEETSYQAALKLITDASEALVSKNGKKGTLTASRKQLEDLRQAREQAQLDEAQKLMAQQVLDEMAQQRKGLAEQATALDKLILRQTLEQEISGTKAAWLRSQQREALQASLTASQAKLALSDGDLDETYLQTGEELLRKWQELTQMTVRLEAAEAELTRDLAEAANLPVSEVSAETLAEVREGEKRARELQERARRLTADLAGLERYLKETDEKDQLAAAYSEARQSLLELEEDTLASREAGSELDNELAAQRRRCIESEQSLYRLELEAEHLNGLIGKNERQLAESERSLAEQVGAAQNRLAQLRRSFQATRQAQNQGKAFWAALGVIAALLAGYFGFSRDPLFFLGFLAAAGFIYRAFADRSSNPREQIRQAEFQLEELEKNGRARIAQEQADLDELNGAILESQAQRESLQQQTAEWNAVLQEMTEASEIREQSLADAQSALFKAKNRTQGLAEQLAKLEGDLAASPVQGTRFALMETKQAIAQNGSALSQLEQKTSRILEDHASADLTELTGRHYDHLTWQAKLAAAREALAKNSEVIGKNQKELERAKTQLLDHIARYQPITEPADASAVLAQLREELGEVLRLSMQMEASLANRSGLEEQFPMESLKERLADLTEQAGQVGAALDPQDTAKDLATLNNELKALLTEIAGLDQAMAARQAQIREKYKNLANISQIDDRIAQVRRRIQGQEAALEAMKMAQSVMGEAFEELQQSFGPLLNDATAEILSQLTRGKYQQVRVNRALEVAVEDPQSNSLYEWGFLSGGTIDQTYLALRLAIAGLIGQDREALPMFLDDVFTQYDDARAQAGLEFLQHYTEDPARDKQVVLFTCHRRIRDWASGMAAVSLRDI